MDCRAIPAVNFKTRLGFKQQDPIMTQEQSVLSKIMAVLAAEEIILQRNVLSFPVDAYFYRYKVCIERDGQGHNDRNLNYEIEREKAIENSLVLNLLGLIQLGKNSIFLSKLHC